MLCSLLFDNFFVPLFILCFYGFIFVFSSTPSNCRYFNPSNFTVINSCVDNSFNFTPHFIPRESWEEVYFNSRDDFWREKNGGVISAYYYKNDPNSPTIIQVHGYRGCKQNGLNILASTILWRAGYNVLSIDLRNHGKSDRYNFQHAVVTFGSEEHKDILGGFDWLQNRTTKPIGVMGVSMGGASAFVAAWKEPRIKAVFGDCAVCKVRETVSDIAHRVSGGLSLGQTFLNFICLGSFKSVYGCPNFKNDAYEAIRNLNQSIHLDHHVEDIVVNRFNTDICGKELKERLGDKASYYFETKHIKNSKCDHHTFNGIFNFTGYQERMVGFFNKYLK